MSIIKAIREYFYTCDMIKDKERIHTDYLPPESNGYSIYSVPSENGGIVREYIGGNQLREQSFVFAVRFNYSTSMDLTNIENSDFFAKLQDWVEKNSKNGIYPKVKGATDLKVTSTGNLFAVDQNQRLAEYQMPMKLYYTKEAI